MSPRQMCSAHHPVFSEVLCTVQGIGMLPDHKLIQCRSMPQCMCFWCSKMSLLRGKPNTKRHTLTPLYYTHGLPCQCFGPTRAKDPCFTMSHQEKDKIPISFKIFDQHSIYCEQLILAYMQHIPIYLDNLSCEAVIILCHK